MVFVAWYNICAICDFPVDAYPVPHLGIQKYATSSTAEEKEENAVMLVLQLCEMIPCCHEGNMGAPNLMIHARSQQSSLAVLSSSYFLEGEGC
jgi:hypothetical protein